MRERVFSNRPPPAIESLPKLNPWFKMRFEPFGHGGDVLQDALNSLHLSKANQTDWVDSRRGKQLRRGPDKYAVVGVLTETERDGNLLIGQCAAVRRQIVGEGPFIMSRPSLYCALEEPFRCPLF
jgi:hypothetical protein